MISNKK